MLKKLWPIYLIQIVNTIGFGLLMPVMPYVIDKYQGGTEIFYGVFISLYSFLQFLSSPVFGKLSDIYGRKFILILSQAGTLFSWIIFAAAWYVDSGLLLGLAIPLWIMTIAHSFDGLTAGNSAVIPAYISDIVEKKDRSKAFALNGAFAGVGIMIGPVIGGVTYASKYGYLTTSIFAILLSFFALIFIFNLKETNLHISGEKFKWSNVFENLNFIKNFKKYSNHKILRTLFFSKLFFFLAFASYTSTFFLYIKQYFDFSPVHLGQFMIFIGSSLVINQAFIGKKIIKKIGDFNALQLGFATSSLALFFVYISSFTSIFFIFLTSYFMTLGISLVFPALSSLSIKQVSDKKRGEISGLMESVGSFANALVPLYATAVYMYLKEYSFLILVFILIIGFFNLFKIKKYNL